MDIDRLLDEKKVQLFVKRIFDIVASGIGLIILFIPMLVIAIFIKLDSKGEILFKQVRVGKNLENFKIFKFRTMVSDAPLKGKSITVGGDRRITKVGSFLRKTKLDEIPQLINVFIGDMSLVGPRPEVPEYVKLYDEDQLNVLKVRPGITDLASIEYRDESRVLAESENPEKAYIEEIMPKKLELNIEYIKNMGLLYDISLIFKTLAAIVK
ncbi:MAG: sugar transferase [Tissierellia bacterium]|nr:sugar transferase [Tissierellia bacterium]